MLSVWVIILVLIQMYGYKGCLEEESTGLLEIKSFFTSISDKEYAYNILNHGLMIQCLIVVIERELSVVPPHYE